MEPALPRPDASASGPPVWRFLVTPRWLGWHLLVAVAFWGMLWLGDWQLHRALTGNGLSWAYTFEWPLFAGFAVVFWARTVRDEFRIRRDPDLAERAHAREPALPAGIVLAASAAADPHDDEEDDPELRAYNAYLARLNSGVQRPGSRGHGRWHGQN